MSKQKEHINFLKGADKDLHDNIIHLDKKLKGLLNAIELKMKGSANKDELTAAEREQLPVFAEEVKKALNSIQGIVSTVVPEGITQKEFAAMNQDILHSLRVMFAGNAKISGLEENF